MEENSICKKSILLPCIVQNYKNESKEFPLWSEFCSIKLEQFEQVKLFSDWLQS